jgi:hypothetical protein
MACLNPDHPGITIDQQLRQVAADLTPSGVPFFREAIVTEATVRRDW